jgi:Rps23 Pro-64 3,4-dihydroxylase Tpa1-like proline 4-hydroxylase
MQIQRYERGQKYEPHFDYFNVKINHRYATVLMYLSTVDKGGETVFPNAKVPTGLHFHVLAVSVHSECSIYQLMNVVY